MIFDREKQEVLEEIGRKIENAIEDIGIVVQFPDLLERAEYEDEWVDSDGLRVLKLEVYYRDDGRVQKAKKAKMEDYKKKLLDEAQRIANEMAKFE